MTVESTAGRSSALALAARAPGWMVWYGEHTGRFWAVPLVATPLHTRLVEARTPEELELEIRRYEGGVSRSPAHNPPPGSAAGSGAGAAAEPGAEPGREPEAPRHHRLPEGKDSFGKRVGVGG
jgi:hypothetical protein